MGQLANTKTTRTWRISVAISKTNIDAEWHFFATSHGKSPCDGIGGTVKTLVARASLQAATSDQILTPHQLFEWVATNINEIQFFYMSTEDIQLHEPAMALEERYSVIKTRANTWNSISPLLCSNILW